VNWRRAEQGQKWLDQFCRSQWPFSNSQRSIPFYGAQPSTVTKWRVIGTSDAVIGICTYHEITRSEQKFDIVEPQRTANSYAQWSAVRLLNVHWNSVNIHDIIWIHPDQPRGWWCPWIDQSLCQILESRRGMGYFSNRVQGLCHQKSHDLTLSLMAKRNNYCTNVLSAQKCLVHGIQMSWFE